MYITYMCGCGMLADIPETVIFIYFSSLLFIFNLIALIFEVQVIAHGVLEILNGLYTSARKFAIVTISLNAIQTFFPSQF